MRKLFINIENELPIKLNKPLFELAIRKFLKGTVRKYICALHINLKNNYDTNEETTSGWFYIGDNSEAYIDIFINNIVQRYHDLETGELCSRISHTICHEIFHFLSFSKLYRKYEDKCKGNESELSFITIEQMYMYSVKEQSEIRKKFKNDEEGYKNWYKNNCEEKNAEIYAYNNTYKFMNI